MVVVAGLCQMIQGSFNQGNILFQETTEIQCACMVLLAIEYSSIKEKGRWKLILTFTL